MKPQAFQPGELRDEYDQIIRAGAYGKKTPFVNSDNSAILDYIINNFDALYAQIPNGRAYVKSVNNITPDSNGNVTVNVGSGGGTSTNITVDSALSSTSTNPVQNKVLYAALNNKLDKNGTATYAARDSSGNIISSTYARKTDLNSYVKSINNMKPDSAGNVNISSSGGGSNITVDFTLDSTSSNAIANKAVYAALNNKLDKTGTAAAATKATQDSYGNVIVTTYARKSDLSGYVKTINNQEPDANGNINISTGGAGTGPNITVDSTLSSTSNNPIANKAVYAAVNNKLDKTGIAAYATRDSSGNIITDTYAKKSEVSGVVKSVNNIAPDSNGNVTITVSGGGTGTNITVDSVLSSTSTNPVQNKVLYAALNNKLDKNGTATYAARDSSGNIISSTYARKTDLNSYVKSINNMKPDSAGNVNISSSGGGSNITVDFTLDSTSSNAIANKAVYAALNNKLDKTGTAAAATKATQDSYGNVIVTTYARKSDLSGYVKTINNQEPDANGNINISTGGAGTGPNITVDSTLSSTSNNPIANKAVYAAVNNKLDKTGIAAYATRDSSGNIITDTYAKKSEVSGVVKSVNNIAPDSNGNVTITVSGGGTGTNITVDSVLSSTSTNPVQNRVVQQEFTSVRAAIPTKVSQLTNDSGYLTQHQSLDGYVKTSGQNVWRAQQTFNLATLGYEQYTTPNSSTSSVSPSTSAASYYATGAFTLNLATLSALLGSNQSTVFTAYITAGGDYALSITNGGTVKYIGEASDVAITSAGLLLNILMTKDSYGSLTSIVQANKLT